jgi:hypothetical protein
VGSEVAAAPVGVVVIAFAVATAGWKAEGGLNVVN